MNVDAQKTRLVFCATALALTESAAHAGSNPCAPKVIAKNPCAAKM